MMRMISVTRHTDYYSRAAIRKVEEQLFKMDDYDYLDDVLNEIYEMNKENWRKLIVQ